MLTEKMCLTKILSYEVSIMVESSLTKRLGLRQGQTILLLNAPEEYLHLLHPLLEDTEIVTHADEGVTFDFVQAFLHNKADVGMYGPVAVQASKPGSYLWFCYPKKSSKVKTDINRDSGWDAVIQLGMRPVTQISIDDTWSALRFRLGTEVKGQRPWPPESNKHE